MKEKFFETFFSLMRLVLFTQDDFLKQKLVEKTKEFFDAVPFPGNVAQGDFTTSRDVAKSNQIVQHDNHVAQSGCHPKVIQLIDGLNELIEIIMHLKLASLSPALTAQKDLLHLRVQIMDAVSLEERQTRRAVNKVIHSVNRLVNKSTQKALRSRESIVDFLKNQPEGMSAVEITEGLQPRFSRRTIHRHLTHLAKTGQVKKTNIDGLPRYYPK